MTSICKELPIVSFWGSLGSHVLKYFILSIWTCARHSKRFLEMSSGCLFQRLFFRSNTNGQSNKANYMWITSIFYSSNMIKYFTECTQLFVQNIHTKRERLFHDTLHTSETRTFLLGEGVTDISLSYTNIQT